MGQDGSNALEDIAFGSVAGMTAKVFEHPFDLIKVRLQSQPTDRALQFTGPLDCFKQTYAKEGWKGLYRGLSAPLVGAACENAVLFLCYNKCQDAIVAFNTSPEKDHRSLSEKAKGKRRELEMPELALAAAGAGAMASFVLTPIELIKCRMQVQMLTREGVFGPSTATTTATGPGRPGGRAFSTTSTLKFPLQTPNPRLPPPLGPIALIVDTIRSSGFRGLWLGQTGTLLRETGGSAAWFSAYELGARFFVARHQAFIPLGEDRKATKADLKTYELMASGALAGMSYNIVLFPADSVKSAMQTFAELNPGSKAASAGFWPTAKRIWKTRGIRGMYAGCGLTVARAAPSSAMIFLIYETLASRFGGIL